MTTTTPGQLLVNSLLPEDLRRDKWTLDKKGIADLFRQVAERYPERYADIAQKMFTAGHFSAQAAGTSLSLKDIMPPPEVDGVLSRLRTAVDGISQSEAGDEEKEKSIQAMVMKAIPLVQGALYEQGIKNNNSLALQVKSGSRGNASQLRQIAAGDMLVEDHRGRVIGVPILNGYSKGLTPAEYWAGSYGARKGTAATKFATRDAGFLGKQLAMISHRLTVTEEDCGTGNGVPFDGGDKDNVGAVLARRSGSHQAGTVIHGKMIGDLKDKQVLVRSPITCQAEHGICAKCAGIRERGKFPEVGENIGITAAQAIGEPLAQGSLSTKHSGGAVSAEEKRRQQNSGFAAINRMIQVPKTFTGAATVATLGGYVNSATPAPQGGQYVKIGNVEHYVQPDSELRVKPGDRVEAGDMVSEGIPNPADVVTHKGIGEGRRSFVHAFRETLDNSGIQAHRRNIEVLSRGLINHVQVHGEDGDMDVLPDDVVPYDTLSRRYRPREGASELPVHRAVGRYLEHPVLHYSIGTHITKPIADEIHGFGIDKVVSHEREPSFSPTMIRGIEHGLNDENWQTRLGSSYLQKGFSEATHRGRASEISGTSFIPALAEGQGFGVELKHTGKY